MSHKRRRNSGYDDSVYRSLVMVTQFGVNMLVPIGMMSALGIWLDGKYHTSFWTILLFFIGAVAGGQNVWRMARSVYAKDGSSKDKRGRKVAGTMQGSNHRDAGTMQGSIRRDVGNASKENAEVMQENVSGENVGASRDGSM